VEKKRNSFFSDSSERVLVDLRGARALTKALTGRGRAVLTVVFSPYQFLCLLWPSIRQLGFDSVLISCFKK